MWWDADYEFKNYKLLNLSLENKSRILKEEVLGCLLITDRGQNKIF